MCCAANAALPMQSAACALLEMAMVRRNSDGSACDSDVGGLTDDAAIAVANVDGGAVSAGGNAMRRQQQQRRMQCCSSVTASAAM